MNLPGDLALLGPELEIVNRHFHSEAPQGHERAWEYALALKAWSTWYPSHVGAYLGIADVGGAGSPFEHMIREVATAPKTKNIILSNIDPNHRYGGETLHEHNVLTKTPNVSALFCISVLEHVKDLNEFVDDLAAAVFPGGLLFLTMDLCGREGPDTSHFHWLRERIFNPTSWQRLHWELTRKGFRSLGPCDWFYYDDQLYGGPTTGFSFASLAMVKDAG
jgi:hypothetical protein